MYTVIALIAFVMRIYLYHAILIEHEYAEC